MKLVKGCACLRKQLFDDGGIVEIILVCIIDIIGIYGIYGIKGIVDV